MSCPIFFLMNVDIVFPDGNENEFIEIGERLGYSLLVFAYSDAKKMPSSFPKSKLKIVTAFIASEQELRKSKKQADIILAKSDGNDRWVFEKSSADILFGLEEAQKKDFMHHRASGLNQVLCKIAHSKEKTIAFSFSSLLNSKGMLRAQIIGKMAQNVKFCRKYKVKTIIASFAKSPYQMRSSQDLASFGEIIGMHPQEAKNALNWLK